MKIKLHIHILFGFVSILLLCSFQKPASDKSKLSFSAEVLSISQPDSTAGNKNDDLYITVHTTLRNLDNSWITYQKWSCDPHAYFSTTNNTLHRAFRRMCFYNVPYKDTIKPYSVHNDTIIFVTSESRTSLKHLRFIIVEEMPDFTVVVGDTFHQTPMLSREYQQAYQPMKKLLSNEIGINSNTQYAPLNWSTHGGAR